MLVVALCGASWLCVLFLGTISRVLGNIHIFPRHYLLLIWLHLSPSQHHSLCSQCVYCSSEPYISFLGKISHSSTLSTIALLHRDLGAISVIPCALSMLTVIPCILDTIHFAPRLVAGWRCCLFLVGCLVEAPIFCWLLVKVLSIFFWLWRCKAVLGFCWVLGAARCSGF